MSLHDVQRTRLFFIDNVRVFLIVLVIGFHAGAPYAGVPWYTIPSETTLLSEFVLGWFLTFCLAFFLGFFFMIAGYFTPGSYNKKGNITFLKDRFLRLGVPLIIFLFVVMPFLRYFLYWLNVHSCELSYWEFIVSEYYWETHHLWFVVNLLLFTGGYWVWRLVSKSVKTKMNLKVPGNKTILFFTILLAVVTFVVRIFYPIGWWDPLKLVEPAYLPQFAGLFVIGVIAYRGNWFLELPTSVGVTWLRIGIITALLFPLLYVVGEGKYSSFIGGFYWKPFVFAFWEAFLCCGMCFGLLVLFREKFNSQEGLGKALSSDVYTVYLIHITIVVLIQYMLIGVSLPPLLKFILVILVAVPLSFLASHYVVRRLPLARKVL